MSTELLKAVADSNQWWAIGPEMILACAALGLLVLEIVTPKEHHGIIPRFAVLSLAMVLGTVLFNLDKTWGGEELFGGLIKLSLPGQFARVFFLLSSLLVCFLGACASEEKVVSYKPFFTGIGSAEFGTEPVRSERTGPATDPTAVVPEEKLVVIEDDGTRTYTSRAPRHVMGHMQTILEENTPEGDAAFLDQLVSEKTIEHYRSQGKDPADFIKELRARQKDIARSFARMPMAEHSPTVIIDQPGDRTWCIRLTGAAAKDVRYTQLWVRLEDKQWKLMWLK